MSVAVIRCADTIGQNLATLYRLPYWRDRLIASYTTRHFAATAAQWAAIPRGHGIRIDQAPTNELFGGAQVKDVEPGAAGLGNAVVLRKQGHKFVTYTFEANMVAARQALPGGPFWVANWNLSEAQAIAYIEQHADVVGVQFASPTSNPTTILPGSGGQTLRSANVDLSVMRASFWVPKAPPPPKHDAEGEWHAELIYHPQTKRLEVRPRPGKNVKMAQHPDTRKLAVNVDLQHGDWHV